jgi:hypothetical protein
MLVRVEEFIAFGKFLLLYFRPGGGGLMLGNWWFRRAQPSGVKLRKTVKPGFEMVVPDSFLSGQAILTG